MHPPIRIWANALFVAFIVAPWLLITMTIPPNMDEFGYFNNLACALHPEGKNFDFFGRCSRFDNIIAGIRYPGRSFFYVSSGASLFYAPWYFLWPHYYSARFCGFLCLLAIFLILRRWTSVSRWTLAAMTFWFFPLMFAATVDTGPIAFQLVATLWLPFALARTRHLWAGFILGILAFLAFSHKYIFFVTIPGMLGIYLILSSSQRHDWRASGAAFLSFTALTYLYLFSRSVDGIDVFQELLEFKGAPIKFTYLSLMHRWREIAPFFTDFSNFAFRIYKLKLGMDMVTIILWVLSAATLGFGIMQTAHRLPILILSISTAGVFLLLLLVGTVNSSHHVAMLFPFLIAVMALALDQNSHVAKRWQWLMGVCMVGSWIWFYLDCMQKNPVPDSSWDRLEITHFLNQPEIAQDHALVFLDWGVSFIQALYGPSQTAVVLDFHNGENLRWLSGKIKARGRTPMFIRRIGSPAAEALDRAIPGLTVVRPQNILNPQWEIAY